jgi:hypothetical protein
VTFVPIEIEHDGKVYEGTYAVDASGEMITVSYGGKSRMTPFGRSESEAASLARIILRDLVEKP